MRICNACEGVGVFVVCGRRLLPPFYRLTRQEYISRIPVMFTRSEIHMVTNFTDAFSSDYFCTIQVPVFYFSNLPTGSPVLGISRTFRSHCGRARYGEAHLPFLVVEPSAYAAGLTTAILMTLSRVLSKKLPRLGWER